MGDLEMIADAMGENHPWRRPSGKYGLFVNWGLELPGRGPGGGANIRTMVSDPDHIPSWIGKYATTRPTAEGFWARSYPIDADTTAEDMWRTGGFGEGDEILHPFANAQLPYWLYPTSDAPAFTGDLGMFTPTSKHQEEVLGSFGASVDRTLFHEAFHRGATQVGAFVGRKLLEEENDLETELGESLYDGKGSDSPRLKQLKEERDLLWEIQFDQEKYLDALDTLEGRGTTFDDLVELSQEHAKEVEEGIEDGPAQEASTKAQAEVQETLDNLERAQSIALRYLPRYRGEALGLNAGGSVDSDLIDITQPARPDPRVDEDWPLEGRDYIVDREGNWIWAHNVEAPGSFRELLEQQQGDEIRLLLGEKLLNSAPSFPLEALSRMKRTKDLKSATRPRKRTASSILKLLEEGGEQSGRDFSDRDYEYFMTLLEEESS